MKMPLMSIASTSDWQTNWTSLDPSWNIEKPIGADIENTNDFALQLENQLIEMLAPHGDAVESIIAQVGEGASDPNQFVGAQATPNKALIAISFVEFERG